jgi:hypothetical protein
MRLYASYALAVHAAVDASIAAGGAEYFVAEDADTGRHRILSGLEPVRVRDSEVLDTLLVCISAEQVLKKSAR